MAHDHDMLKGLMLTAGYQDIEIVVVSETIEGCDPNIVAQGLGGGNPGILEIPLREIVVSATKP